MNVYEWMNVYECVSEWVNDWLNQWINEAISALTLLVGQQEEYSASKKLGIDMLMMVIWLELGADVLCMPYSSTYHRHHFRHLLL